MRWNNRLPVLAGLALVLLLLSGAAEERRLTIYAPQVSFSLPVVGRQGREYVGMLEALEPLGTVNARLDGRNWRLRFNDLSAEFRQDQSEGKVGGARVTLSAPFLIENKRGLVPLDSLSGLLARFLNTQVDSHPAARRMFVGNVATRFTSELRRDTLTLHFSAPVNPVLSTEPGKLHMTFKREPLVSEAASQKFEGAGIASLAYAETNGQAELTVYSQTPLMATFGSGGRTITMGPAPGQAAAPLPPPAPPATAAPVTPPPPQPAPAARSAYLIVIDASHGGEERGAALSDKLAEKDVALALARSVRSELQRRGLDTMMLRDGDLTQTGEQRAVTANSARPALYIALHAGTMGHGVRVFTSMLEDSHLPRGGFLPWDTVQAAYVEQSSMVAQEIEKEIAGHRLPVQSLAAALRPLNHIAAPAVALEVAPATADLSSLQSAEYQHSVALAVATAVVNLRGRLNKP